MPKVHVQPDSLPSVAARRYFLGRLFATFIGVLVLVLLGVFFVQLQALRGLLEASDLAAVTGSSLRWLALGVVAAVPILYLVGGRALARRFADSEDRAARDSLTGLNNDWSFREALRHEVARTQRFSDPFTLAVVNVDDFAFLNENQGHDAADDVLIELSRALRTGRSVDLPFRVGGDEFAVIMPHTDLTGAAWAVTRIRQEARSRMGVTTVSVGLALFEAGEHTRGGDLDAAMVLRDHADLALYEAKRRGRDAVVSYAEIEEAMGSDATAAAITIVRQLLREGQLVAQYRPIWDLRTHEVIGFEARAVAPVEYGLDRMADVIGAARLLGVAERFDELCRATVLAGVGDLPEGAFLLVAVAPEVFDHDDDAPERVRRELELAGLTPDRVVLALGDGPGELSGAIVGAIADLRALGFRVALDDQGAHGAHDARGGHSSDAEPDVVQVDGSDPRIGTRGSDLLADAAARARARGATVLIRGLDLAGVLAAAEHVARVTGRAGRSGAEASVVGVGDLLGSYVAEAPSRGAQTLAWPSSTVG